MSYLHALPKGFVVCKVTYIFKVVCLTDLFMILESFVNIFMFCLVCLKYFDSVENNMKQYLTCIILHTRDRDLFMVAAE